MKAIDSYRSLASAIFLMAYKDWKKIERKLTANPENKAAQDEAEEIRSFLRSDWAVTLEDLADVTVVEKMKEIMR